MSLTNFTPLATTVKLYLLNPKSKDVPVTIYASVRAGKGQRFKVLSDEKAAPKDWDSVRQEVKAKAHDALTINLYLQDFKRNLLALYRENRHKTFAEFRGLVQKSAITTDEKKTLFLTLDSLIESYKRDKSPLTPKNYEALKGHLENMNSVTFEGMDFNFLDTLRSTLSKAGLQDSTINKYVKRLKTFLTWASDRGHPVNPTYKRWKITNRQKEPFSITWEQLQRLHKADLSGHASIGRAAFMIISGTGARISDVKHLTTSKLTNTMSGKLWSYWRKKNHLIKAEKVTVPLNGPLGELALHYLDEQGGRFPDYSEQKLNIWIREAFEKAEIELSQKVHAHIGRKTFITIGLHYMSEKTVCAAAGISRATLRFYEGKTDVTVMQQQFEHMRTALKDMETKLRAS